MAGRPAARRHLGIKRIAHLSASGLGASSYGVNPPLLFGPGGRAASADAPASAQLQIDSAWFVAERLIAVPLNQLDRRPKRRGVPPFGTFICAPPSAMNDTADTPIQPNPSRALDFFRSPPR